ncbi:hypothetical protein ACFQQB_01100 [Nonomuraea rubra]|uniref:hypothetical protein n=1 Tax=Nonomuraea rubra TaxID=46180 RepID=UPI00360C7852
MTEYRASFDAAIAFSNGGDLTVHGFRVDLPGPDASEADIAALFVASLGLLMTDTVRLTDVRIFPEPHKGTRGGPSDPRHDRQPASGEGRGGWSSSTTSRRRAARTWRRRAAIWVASSWTRRWIFPPWWCG